LLIIRATNILILWAIYTPFAYSLRGAELSTHSVLTIRATNITMLDTNKSWCPPSYKSLPIQWLHSVQIRSRPLHDFSDIYVINIKTKHSLMCWKWNNNAILLILVLDRETLWIILQDHDKMLHHQFAPTLYHVGP
jgi:hypothetical protein